MKKTQSLYFQVVILMQLHHVVCFNGLPSIRNAPEWSDFPFGVHGSPASTCNRNLSREAVSFLPLDCGPQATHLGTSYGQWKVDKISSKLQQLS